MASSSRQSDSEEWSDGYIPAEPLRAPPVQPRALGFAARLHNTVPSHLRLEWTEAGARHIGMPYLSVWEAYARAGDEDDDYDHRYSILLTDHPRYPYRLYIEGTESLEFSTLWGSLADAQTAAQWDWAYGRYYDERDIADGIRSIWDNAIRRNVVYGPEPGAPQPTSDFRYRLPNPLRAKETDDA